MARTLESLDPGTPVLAGETQVGVVSGVYADGSSRSADIVAVRWDARGGDVAVPATEIMSIDAAGVRLIRQEPDQYADLAPFDPARFPTLRRIA
ncbi:MAG TPA: hypothetical protein VGN14_02015 [Candidatus Elarobacter sp.]|jgi:hypothetical protein